MIIAMKAGVADEMTTSVKPARAAFTKSILKVRASTSSTRYMSLGVECQLLFSVIQIQWPTNLEKRFKILPAGVVSKKLMGDLKIA
jgi:hypothetical protein